MRTCTVPGCTTKHAAHGYCQLHAMRVRRHGDPLVTMPLGYYHDGVPSVIPTDWTPPGANDGLPFWLAISEDLNRYLARTFSKLDTDAESRYAMHFDGDRWSIRLRVKVAV